MSRQRLRQQQRDRLRGGMSPRKYIYRSLKHSNAQIIIILSTTDIVSLILDTTHGLKRLNSTLRAAEPLLPFLASQHFAVGMS